jgi:hypothetical protein
VRVAVFFCEKKKGDADYLCRGGGKSKAEKRQKIKKPLKLRGDSRANGFFSFFLFEAVEKRFFGKERSAKPEAKSQKTFFQS